MPENAAGMFYRWLKFCIKFITRFKRCSKIIYRVKERQSYLETVPGKHDMEPGTIM